MDDITKDPNRRNAYGQYTHYPFAKPRNRYEARENAQWYAGENQYDASLAWSAIAETFPHEEYELDPRPMAERNGFVSDDTAILTTPGASNTMVLRPSEMAPTAFEDMPPHRGRVNVDAVAWDVLRALAARYVLSSMDKHATVDLSEHEIDRWELKMTRMPDSGVVQVFVETPRSV